MRTVLITGGSRGIGKSLVEEFNKNGYKVIFLYLKSEDAAKSIIDRLNNVYAFKCDISSENEIEAVLSEILSEHREIDVLINNAGISYEGLLSEMSFDDWMKIINVNLSSMFLTCRKLIPHFVSKKNGKIINITSMWGEVGASCEVAYSASKAGVIGFTKALAKELAPSGITVNAVSPGIINTDMMSGFTDEDIKVLCEQTPLGRIGKGTDIAQTVLFLASENADFITGQTISVNGGFVI